jgi:hypothetical protein
MQRTHTYPEKIFCIAPAGAMTSIENVDDLIWVLPNFAFDFEIFFLNSYNYIKARREKLSEKGREAKFLYFPQINRDA